MTDRSKSLGFPNGNGEKIFQGETRLFGVCQDFTERYASIMERKRGIEQSIITEFDLISPFIEDMGNTGIDYVIDTRIVHYFPISVIPIGGVAERYPTIRKRLAEEYFLPKMSLFFSKWKEYLYEKVASLEATKPEALGHIRGYQVNAGYDRDKECFVLVFSKREFY